jgi:hypothetical protein
MLRFPSCSIGEAAMSFDSFEDKVVRTVDAGRFGWESPLDVRLSAPPDRFVPQYGGILLRKISLRV